MKVVMRCKHGKVGCPGGTLGHRCEQLLEVLAEKEAESEPVFENRCSGVIEGTDRRCQRQQGPKGGCGFMEKPKEVSAVDHPRHYNAHPSGVECIDIVETLPFNVGNAIKYLWRGGLKSPDPLEDLKKAAWYVTREIARLEKAHAS